MSFQAYLDNIKAIGGRTMGFGHSAHARGGRWEESSVDE